MLYKEEIVESYLEKTSVKAIKHGSLIRVLLRDGKMITGSYYKGKMSIFVKGSYFYSVNTYSGSKKVASLSLSYKKETVGTFVTNEKIPIPKSEIAWIDDWDYMD